MCDAAYAEAKKLMNLRAISGNQAPFDNPSVKATSIAELKALLEDWRDNNPTNTSDDVKNVW
jgi:hypothetical protein